MRLDVKHLRDHGWELETDGKTYVEIHPTDLDHDMPKRVANAIDGRGLTPYEMESIVMKTCMEVQKVQLFKLMD